MAYLQFPSPTQLRNLADPDSSTDAATKGYVDAAIGGSTGNISVDNISANTANITAVTSSSITTTNITSTGNVTLSGPNIDLGNIANIIITGGQAGYILQTDGFGNLSWVNPATTVPNLEGVVDEFVGTGSQTDFTLSAAPVSKNVTFAVVQGIMQPKSSYSVSGTTLSFSQAPPNGAVVEITIMRIASS